MATPRDPTIRIRAYDAAAGADRRAIRRIFGLTGLFGEPVSKYFGLRAAEFVADSMLEYYLEFEQPWLLVSECGEDESTQVTGYIIGCPDSAARLRRAVTWMVPKLAVSMARNRLLNDRATLRLVWNGLPEQIAKSVSRRGQPDLRPYPAHLHMAVDPAWQGRGTGKALLAGFLKRLRVAGVRGVHLETTSRHAAAAALYRSAGFREIARHRTRVFDHLLPAAMLPVERVIMAMALTGAAADAEHSRLI